jgi:hypothetical protein
MTTSAQGGTRSRPYTSRKSTKKQAKRRTSATSVQRRRQPRPTITKDRRNVENGGATATSRHVPLLSLRAAAKRLGMTPRKLWTEVLVTELAGVRRETGVYVDLEQLKSFITPGGRS